MLSALLLILTNCESDSIGSYLFGGDGAEDNTAPTANFEINPETGNTQTVFSFDASYCSDEEDETSVLQVRWDWENDGTWDTGFSTTKTATHKYTTDENYTVKLEVKDSEDLTDQSTKSLNVTQGGSGGQNIIAFWTATDNVELNVYINGSLYGTITESYPEAPGCWAEGCVTYSTDDVTISYRAESTDGKYKWSEKTINLNSGCASMHLRINTGGGGGEGDATFSDIKVNGVSISGFDPNTYVYNIALPACTLDYPEVTGTTSNPDAGYIRDDSETLPGVTHLEVNSADWQNTITYILNFTVQELEREFGTVTDTRNGKTYNTVKLGNQWWMAENLNLPTNTGSYCWEDDVAICETDGRLYTWSTAMDLDSEFDEQLWNGSDINHKGICPQGWHIPNDNEWKGLELFLGMSQSEADKLNTYRGDFQGTYLKPGGCTGFEGLLAGRYDSSTLNPYGYERGTFGYFWASTEDTETVSLSRQLSWDDKTLGRYRRLKTNGLSVRCVKD